MNLGEKVTLKHIIIAASMAEPTIKRFWSRVGFGTAAKVAQADDNSKIIIENALKKTFAPIP
jgi:ATP-dependent Clp protease ATP-binding subunit ClpC